MRGRLWALFWLQAGAAAFCCGMSRMGGSLGGTIGLAAAMAVAVTAAAGATFGIGAGGACLFRDEEKWEWGGGWRG